MDLITADTPGLQPPPGQVPNFDNPWSIQSVTLAFVIIFLVTTTLSTFARIYTKFFVAWGPGWDDYTMIFGWLAYVVNFAVSMVAFQYGAGIHQWDVRLIDVASFAYWAFISQMLYCFIICPVKVSICLQVLRIFVVGRSRAFWAIWTFIGIQIAWWFTNFWVNIFQCTPVQKGYQPQRDGTCLPGFGNYLIAVAVFNVISDILIWVFPLVYIGKLRLSYYKKIGVAAVFSIGFFAIIASALRTVFTVRYVKDGADATFVLTQFALCTQAEFVAGIIAGNSVTLPKFWMQLSTGFSSLRSSKSSQRSRSSVQVDENAVAEHFRHEPKNLV